MNTTDKYKDYAPEVQEYMKMLIDSLTADYGSINPSWWISLDLIADNLWMYKEGIKTLRNEGLSYKNREGRLVKNPAFSICNNAQAILVPLLKSFAANPVQRSKLKALESVDSDTIKDNYIASLTE